MKRIITVCFISCFVFVSLLISPANGAVYVSKDFPPEEVLVKALGGKVKIVGKYQEADGRYQVFYYGSWGRKMLLMDTSLQKLDTDIWIIRTRDGIKVLQDK